MAAKKKEATYTSKAVITKISATSRISLKIKKTDTFYTLEYSEERCLPEDANIQKERDLLWDAVNMEVDKQAEDVRNLYGD